MIEVVGYRHGYIFRYEVDTVEAGIWRISWALDDGTWAGVGVFVDGEPHAIRIVGDPDESAWREPTEDERRSMRDEYARSTSDDDDG